MVLISTLEILFCNNASASIALTISSVKESLLRLTVVVKLPISTFIASIKFLRVSRSVLILVLKEAEERLIAFLFKLMDVDN
jgi:hypothetical protein